MVVPPKTILILIAILAYTSVNPLNCLLSLGEGEHLGKKTKIKYAVQNSSNRSTITISDSDEIAFEEKWPNVKGKLCPDNVPSSRKYGE